MREIQLQSTFLTIVCAVGLSAGCGDDRRAPDGGVVDAPAAGQVPRFEETPCRFELASELVEHRAVTCGDVVVDRDRDQPGGLTLRLHVARFHGDPGAAPVVLLNGGPGVKVSEYLPLLGSEFIDAMTSRGDFIVFDMRGVGQSVPALECPELGELAPDLANPAAFADAYATALGECQERLTAMGIDLTAYDSRRLAADAADVVRAMGYERANLLGASYGGRVALEVMRRHPGVVRAAVLDAPAPPHPPWIIETGKNFDEALGRLLAACAQDAACQAAYGDLEQTLSAAIDRLDADQPTNPETGRTLTGNDLAMVLLTFMYSRETLAKIPAVLQAASEGRFEDMFSIIEPYELDWPAHLEMISWGMHHSVVCADSGRFITDEQLEGALEGVRTELLPVFSEYWNPVSVEPCATWPLGPADESLTEPVMSDVPSLMLVGEYDPITPRRYAEDIASSLSESVFLAAPNTGHVVTWQAGACGRAIVLDFLQNPEQAPDAACLADLDLEFELPQSSP